MAVMNYIHKHTYCIRRYEWHYGNYELHINTHPIASVELEHESYGKRSWTEKKQFCNYAYKNKNLI